MIGDVNFIDVAYHFSGISWIISGAMAAQSVW